MTPWTLCQPASPRFLCLWDFPSKNTGVGCHFLHQGIFLKQGLNLHLLHWQVGSLPLSHLESPSVQFSCSVVSVSTEHPMDCSMPGLPVNHQLLELTQTHVHRVSDGIQLFHPLSSPYPLSLNLSQHQGLFKWVHSSHQVAKVLAFQLQHQSFQWIFRTDFL